MVSYLGTVVESSVQTFWHFLTGGSLIRRSATSKTKHSVRLFGDNFTGINKLQLIAMNTLTLGKIDIWLQRVDTLERAWAQLLSATETLGDLVIQIREIEDRIDDNVLSNRIENSY